MSHPLAGKRVLVTGASSGVGHSIALAVAAAGALPIVTGRNAERLEELDRELRAAGAEPVVHRADLADPDGVLGLAGALAGHPLDGLVHCAGVIELGSVADSDEASLERQLRLNLRAPAELTRRLLPALSEARGQVVFLNSTAALAPSREAAAYAASKAALRAFADSLRQEINENGVRVTTIFLGRTATPMQQTVHEHEGREYRPEKLVQPEDVAALTVGVLALPRTAEVTEIRLRPAQKP